ncbi:MAG: site-specific integrase [Lachnospiraceae bacterium]|nr:site-specific integrase [Lachnospiraceae bacterium]
MPAYKYTLKGGRTQWYAAFYYVDWTGQRKHHVKRGFSTQREAKEYEKTFLDRNKDKSDILFSSLTENYYEDMKSRLKPTTMESKHFLIDQKVLPYFKDLKVCDIDVLTVRKWQNSLLQMKDRNGKKFSQTYLKTINDQLSAIMNYAVKHYGLPVNPCHLAGTIGKKNSDEMDFWTVEQFNAFIAVTTKTGLRIAYEVLFWTGIRCGELLALTPADILQGKEISINKNYVKIKGGYVIQTPKTERGKRTISIPDFLYDEIEEYISNLYGIQKEDRIFYFTKAALENNIKTGAKRAGLPEIRLHDLRHSNVAMLIEMGVDIMEIARRLGHESVKTTWDTYAHLYPNKDRAVADRLHTLHEEAKYSADSEIKRNNPQD